MTVLSDAKSNSCLCFSGVQRAVIKNWKTTTIGIILAFSSFVSFSPETFGGRDKFIVKLSFFISSGGLAVLGISAKDFNGNGGTTTAKNEQA